MTFFDDEKNVFKTCFKKAMLCRDETIIDYVMGDEKKNERTGFMNLTLILK